MDTAEITSKLSTENKNNILYLGFNHTFTFFTVGTEDGFRICYAIPAEKGKLQVIHRKLDGGIGIVEMLYQTNLFALVGGGRNPKFPPNKVIIWDDNLQKVIGELTFRTMIRSVKLKRDKIIVAVESKIYIYNFSDFKILDQFETKNNINGLCAISYDSDKSVFLCPAYVEKGTMTASFYDTNKTIQIKAHENEIAYIAINYTGTLAATASIKGTIIRVFDIKDGNDKKILEFRRGIDETSIRNMCFDTNSKWLAVSSDKGTIHIYSLVGKTDVSDYNARGNTVSRMPFKSWLPEYFSSEWSQKQIKISEMSGSKMVLGFGKDDTLIVISENGYHATIKFMEDESKYTLEKIDY